MNNPLVNLGTPGWRTLAYVVTALGTPVVAYLNAKGILDAGAVTLWSAEVAVVGAIAASNASETPED